MTEVAARECPICGRWPANLRPAMRSAVWSLSLREWQCKECEEAFWANQIEASEQRRRTQTAPQRPQLFSCDSGVRQPAANRAGGEDAPVRGHRPGPYRAHSPLAPDSGREPTWSRLTVENVLNALLVAYFVGLAVMWWWAPS
jgi:hypothetical protein